MNVALRRSGDINGIILKGTDISKCCTFLLLLAYRVGVFRGTYLSSLDERRAPLKLPAWEAILLQVFRDSDMFHSIGMSALFVNYWLLISVITPSQQVVRDFDLFRLLGALVFVDALLLVIWMTLHPPSRNVIIQTEGTRSVRLGSTKKWFKHLVPS